MEGIFLLSFLTYAMFCHRGDAFEFSVREKRRDVYEWRALQYLLYRRFISLLLVGCRAERRWNFLSQRLYRVWKFLISEGAALVNIFLLIRFEYLITCY